MAMDYGSTEADLQAYAKQKGIAYDPSDFADVQRAVENTGTTGTSALPLDQAVKNAYAKYDQRAATGGPGGPSQAPTYTTPTQAWNAAPSSAPAGSSDQLYALLMQRAQQGTAVDRNDPNIRAQVDPAVAQQERASRQYLDQQAEQAGPLANLQGERRLASERSGQAAGQLESDVIGREITARRDEIQQALSLWGQQLSSDERLALERELAILNDQARTADRGLQAQGLAQNNDQFLRDLALRESNQNNTWDFNWANLGA